MTAARSAEVKGGNWLPRTDRDQGITVWPRSGDGLAAASEPLVQWPARCAGPQGRHLHGSSFRGSVRVNENPSVASLGPVSSAPSLPPTDAYRAIAAPLFRSVRTKATAQW